MKYICENNMTISSYFGWKKNRKMSKYKLPIICLSVTKRKKDYAIE